jgi:glycosyltransferase involved in cell wall biosynthesis
MKWLVGVIWLSRTQPLTSTVHPGTYNDDVRKRIRLQKQSHRRSKNFKFGVNVVGYFSSELGMGEQGRIVVRAVELSGIPFSTITSNRNESRKFHPHQDRQSEIRRPVNIFVINADQMVNWKELPEFRDISQHPTVGVWAWELEDFPNEFSHVFDTLQEVWTISEFARKAIQQQTEKPVHVLPMPISRINIQEIAKHNPFSETTREHPYFLSIFDFQSSMDRKNPIATIEAFKRAFNKDENVKLVIKTINGNLWPKQKKILSNATLGYENIHIFDQYLERAEVLSLIKNSLAYVSLHRSEGYGLTLAESMELGTPVIATGYSGNMDFMDENNSLLVDYELVDVADSSGAYRVKSRWADPRIESAAAHMKRIFDDPVFAEIVGLAGRESVKKSRDMSLTVDFIHNRVRTIKRANSPYALKRMIKISRQTLARHVPRKLKNFIRKQKKL